MSDDERDLLHAGVMGLMQSWIGMWQAHLKFLHRRVQERVSTVLRQSSLSPWTKMYWSTWAQSSFIGRYEAHVAPGFMPRHIPAEPTEQYCWERVRESFQLSNDVYYAARDKATLEANDHKDEIDSVRRIVDEAGAQIEMAAVISNGMMARLGDPGLYLALGQLGPALNAQTGPRTKAALEEMRQRVAQPNRLDVDTEGLLSTPQPVAESRG